MPGSSFPALGLAAALALHPIEDPNPDQFAPPPAEPAPLVLAVDPPAPVAELEPPSEPVPSVQVRAIDGPRPMVGTGLLAVGGLAMGVSGVLVVTALAGPGWADLDQRDAAILAGVSVPFALAGIGMVVTGAKTQRKFRRWAERNQLSPPKPGNGAIVAGTAISITGIAGVAAGTQAAVTEAGPSRGQWVAVGLSAGLTAIGVTVVVAGMLDRSKFAAWERGAQLSPAPLAWRGGGGLGLAGRF